MDANITDVYDFIFKIDRRIGYLEKDLTFIEKKISEIGVFKKTSYSVFQLDLNTSKQDIEDIRAKLKEIMIIMTRLSQEMKDTIKKNQSKAISEKIDSIQFQDFLTRKELLNNSR